MKAVLLSEPELNSVLTVIPSKFTQARRLVEHLADNPNSITSTVAKTCGIGNISDVARKINPTLFRRSLFISCRKPAMPVRNKFGEVSNMFEWGIYYLPPEPQNSLELDSTAQNN